MKSSAVSSSPVVQLTPLSRVNVQDRPSLAISHLFASPGMTCQFLSRRISGSVKWSPHPFWPPGVDGLVEVHVFQPSPVWEAAWTVYCFSDGAASAGRAFPKSLFGARRGVSHLGGRGGGRGGSGGRAARLGRRRPAWRRRPASTRPLAWRRRPASRARPALAWSARTASRPAALPWLPPLCRTSRGTVDDSSETEPGRPTWSEPPLLCTRRALRPLDANATLRSCALPVIRASSQPGSDSELARSESRCHSADPSTSCPLARIECSLATVASAGRAHRAARRRRT